MEDWEQFVLMSASCPSIALPLAGLPTALPFPRSFSALRSLSNLIVLRKSVVLQPDLVELPKTASESEQRPSVARDWLSYSDWQMALLSLALALL